jgi:subtilisin family serine protease
MTHFIVESGEDVPKVVNMKDVKFFRKSSINAFYVNTFLGEGIPPPTENYGVDKGAVRLGNRAFLIESEFNLADRSLYPDIRAMINEKVDLKLPEPPPGGAGEFLKNSWAIEKWGVRKFFEKGLSGKGIKIGIVDSGLDISHPLFISRLGKLRAFSSFNNDGELEGESKDLTGPGLSSVEFEAYSHWHGTHCAGIICAGESKEGPHGVAPGVDLYVAKVLDKYQAGTVASIYAGLSWLEQFKCDIISLSLGWHGYRDQWSTPIINLLDGGAAIVAAAGNEFGLASYGQTRSPANYPLGDYSPEKCFFSVGAIDEVENVWDRSGGENVNWPETYVEGDGTVRPTAFSGAPSYLVPSLVGPGVNISSTTPGGGFELSTGTSMAAPFVAGLLALILERLRQKDADATPAAAGMILRKSLYDTPPLGPDIRFGNGVPVGENIMAQLFGE